MKKVVKQLQNLQPQHQNHNLIVQKEDHEIGDSGFIRAEGVKKLVNKKLTFNKRGLLNVSALFNKFFTTLALINSESSQKNK